VTWHSGQLKHWLEANDSGVWGDDPSGESDTTVLRSTDIALDGSWTIVDPATRSIPDNQRLSKRLMSGDLVVVTSSGSEAHLGKTAIVNESVASLRPVFANFVQRLRAGPNAEPRFVRYVLMSTRTGEEMAVLGNTTTGLRNLNGTIIGATTFPGPPLAEQRAIADYLDVETARIDALIAKKQQLIHLLEERLFSAVPHDPGVDGVPYAPLRRFIHSIVDGPFGSSIKSNDYTDLPGIRVVRLGNIGLAEFRDGDAAFLPFERFAEL